MCTWAVGTHDSNGTRVTSEMDRCVPYVTANRANLFYVGPPFQYITSHFILICSAPPETELPIKTLPDSDPHTPLPAMHFLPRCYFHISTSAGPHPHPPIINVLVVLVAFLTSTSVPSILTSSHHHRTRGIR